MYAVIRAGGKQYRVAPGDVVKIEKSVARRRRISTLKSWQSAAKKGRSPKSRMPRSVGEIARRGTCRQDSGLPL